MQFANKRKVTVASYKEILIGFLTFALILFVLYPKDLIMEQILQEKSNYDLSVLYLKNMLRNDPKNEKLILTLAQKSIRSQNRDLALKLLALLKTSKNEAVQKESYLLSYKLLKQNYFFYQHKHNRTKMDALKKELRHLFLIILNKHFYTKKDLSMLYQEAIFLQSREAQYILIQKRLDSQSNNVKLLNDALYLSVKLKHYDKAFTYLDHLTRIDTKHKNKWNNERYYLLTQAYSYQKLEKYLQKEAQNSSFWQKKLIALYLEHKEYRKAAAYSMSLFHKTNSFNKRKKLWLQALDVLVSGNLLHDAVQLGSKYENYFIRDKEARVKLLKLYLSADEVQKAKNLSAKILKVIK